ncbi:seipin-2-like isoform X1 [Zingiber officinale]|uniref:seipin-2-like isoform X1 n=1 Tax=Zingiber officinale TaxID=94328 RepID=UPI001C4AD600|nr:seipin-2-like isoform X1 [Zingiber officinale]
MEAWDSHDEEEEREEEELDFFDALEFLPEQDEVFLSDSPPHLGLDSPSGKRWKTLLPLEGQGSDSESSTSSSITSEKVANGGGDGREEVPAQSGATAPARPADSEENGARSQPRRGFLESSVDVVIKSVFFQFSLLIGFAKLSFCVLFCPFYFFLDPFGLLRRASDAARRRIFRLFKDFLYKIHPFWVGRLIEPQEAVKLLVRLAWGCFWSLYVCFILFALLAASSLATFLAMRRVVEAPVSMTEELSFDYAKPIPEALVPVTTSDGCFGSGETIDVVGHEFRRLVSPNKKLQLTISLKLPESDYNRKLGVFQVRVELLTSDGKVTSSSRHPCLLRFKSSQIHFLQTFLKSLFLLAGYSDESQVLKLPMKGLTEGTKPTTCIRVSLEQRAEYRDGAGIPEIYSASMKLESELPLVKRILWNWKITVFVWTTMVVFILLLLAVLVCCRSILTPGARRGGGGPGG